jgi:hypothetical protein
MSSRVTKRFTVVEFDDGYVWLELLDGEKRGLQFAFPLDKGCGKELNELEQGENIKATVESLNDKKTAWKCIQFVKDSETSPKAG